MAMSRSLGGTSFTTRPPISMAPAGRLLQPGDDVEQRRFAAAGGADQHGELAAFDLQVDALQHVELAETLAHIANGQRGHRIPFTSPPRR